MQILCDRQALHRIPELDRELPKTMAYLKDALAGLRCQVFEPASGSLCAWFDFGKDQALAFRSDADALPIAEQTGLPYASCHPGRMHACGHDGHMAMLLELARWVNAQTELKHNILLIFQCAEETTGGAYPICANGVLEKFRVRAIFGMHLWPGLEEGQIASRCNEMISRSCSLTVDIYGRSAHVARAHEGRDALAAGVEFYSRAMALEAALPQSVFRLLKFGKMESGTVSNAISAHTRLEGSVRAFQEDVFRGLQEGLKTIGQQIEAETECRVELTMDEGYPPVMNDPALYARVRELADFRELEAPSMITEDFAWYQKYVPGVFFFLGTGASPALHADTFNFNEEVLLKGAAFFQMLAREL